MRIGPDPFIDSVSRAQSSIAGRINAADDNNKSNSFGEILQITMTGRSQAQKEASAVSRHEAAKLLIGEEDNLIDHMIKSEQASALFDLNLAIRNKVLDAFNEIMRTQV